MENQQNNANIILSDFQPQNRKSPISSLKIGKSAHNEFVHFNSAPRLVMNASTYIAEGDIEKIKTLEHNQGHDLKTILNNYNVYTKAT